jgi:hypothetical protein
MAVTRLIERIEDQVRSILEERAAPEDTVEWDVTIIPVHEPCLPDGEVDAMHFHRETMLSLYATLEVPEVGACKSVAHALVPLHMCAEKMVDDWVNQVWESLVIGRLSTANGMDGLDHDPGGG